MTRDKLLLAAAGNTGGGGGDNWSYDPNNLSWNGEAPFWSTYDNSVTGGTNSSWYGWYLKPDGTSLFGMNSSGQCLRADMTTAYKVATASWVSGQYRILSSPSSVSRGLFFRDNGERIYWCDGTTVRQLDLSTAWDLTTTSNEQTFSYSTQESGTSQVKDIAFKSDGSSFYLCVSSGSTNNRVLQYDMTTAWDITTASYNQAWLSPSNAYANQYLYGISFKPDGTKLYLSNTGPYVTTWTLTTPWDISTAGTSYVLGIFYQAVYNTNYGNGILWKSDGSYFIYPSTTLGQVCEFYPSTAWVTGYAEQSYDGNNSSRYSKTISFKKLSSLGVSFYSMTFNADGTKIILAGSSRVTTYNLGTAYEIDTASSSGVTSNSSISSQTGYGKMAIQFNDDGTKFYVASIQNKKIFEYDLSTAYDVTTATYNSVSLDLTVGPSSSSSSYGFSISSDGTELYTFMRVSPYVFQWTLSTPWDLSTASYTRGATASVFSSYNYALQISPDGTEMFSVKGQSDPYLEKYTLSTAYDISTATKTASKIIRAEGVPPFPNTYVQYYLKEDGSTLYIVDYYGTVSAQMDL